VVEGELDGDDDNRPVLVGLPILLDRYQSFPHVLSTSLLRIATEIRWDEELPYFEGVCIELGYFYVDLPYFRDDDAGAILDVLVLMIE